MLRQIRSPGATFRNTIEREQGISVPLTTRSEARHFGVDRRRFLKHLTSDLEPLVHSNRYNARNRNRHNSSAINDITFSNRYKLRGSDDATSIVTLSDQRELKGPSSSLMISNRQWNLGKSLIRDHLRILVFLRERLGGEHRREVRKNCRTAA